MTDFSISIAVFGYKRPEKLDHLLSSIKSSNALPLISSVQVFVDGPKNENGNQMVLETQRVALAYEGGKFSVFLSPINKGLESSILSGVSVTFESNDAVIVLEDDLKLDEYALQYFVDCLLQFSSTKVIGAINGFCFLPTDKGELIHLDPRPNSWGWATWKENWDAFLEHQDSRLLNEKSYGGIRSLGHDMPRMLRAYVNGKIDSWAIQWAEFFFSRKLLCVSPRYRFCENAGHQDSQATHTKNKNSFDQAENTQREISDSLMHIKGQTLEALEIDEISVLMNSNFIRFLQKVLPNSIWIIFLNFMQQKMSDANQ